MRKSSQSSRLGVPYYDSKRQPDAGDEPRRVYFNDSEDERRPKSQNRGRVTFMQRKVRSPKPDKRAASKDQSFVSLFLNPLFGFRLKLTLSYALVTVATLLVVELVVVVGLSAIVGSGLMSRIMAHGLAEAVVPSVEPYLARTPPDLEGLQKDLGMISDEPPARRAEDVPGSTFEETLTE